TAWLHGISYDEQLPFLDYAFSEEPNKPGTINKHGAAITRARTFKTARAFDVAIQTYHHGGHAGRYELSLAENLAFNPRGLGHFGTPLKGFWAPGQAGLAEQEGEQKLAKQYLDFYRAHREQLFVETRSLASVAVYRDTESLAYNCVETHLSQVNVEQALIERNIPFDLVYPRHLEDLARYRAVILPNSECLSDAAVAKLHAYVQAGGGLLWTEQTGVYDDWRRVRPEPALKAWLGDAPAGLPARGTFGSGKVAYLPVLDHVEQPSTKPEVWYVFNEYWAAPRNTADLLDALAYVAGPMPYAVQAQSGRPVVEAVATPCGATAVHVLNMDTEQPICGLEVRLYREEAPREILPLSPTWNYQPIPFEYDEAARQVRFRFEELPRYAVFKVL
ncbi:MAG: beta-galactosidase trimerization domain-containing protein, partial [Planctomycetota bacterium]|nr:beta-galactosidase trimerization domain-containing protein [Planctomycetota bacterium]